MPTKRQSKTRRRQSSDADLILQFMRGEIGRRELDRLGGPFFIFAMKSGRVSDLTSALWIEHGPALLAACTNSIPDNIWEMIHISGWPRGDFTLQRILFDRRQRQRLDDLLSGISRAH
jgi:hypothetical protein